ncbi:MAG: CAP domain-containing protein [Prolixibacteraceae bacterium]|jgi:hypothetical protein|nr:CAP domain-containing protein [Prolixibacteraceae bacterium]
MQKKHFIIIMISLLFFGCKEENVEPTDDSLYGLINQYRQEQGLSAVPYSISLTIVAETHIDDLIQYYTIDETCNLHSWSENGNWASCCYTSDHEQAECMWNKPRELTSYEGAGYEIAAYKSSGITAERALELWKNSDAHNNIISNQDIWTNIEWKAMGTAIKGDYAVVWFGEEKEPE